MGAVMFSRGSVVQVSKDQVSCDMGGEAAILNGSSGMYYGLNGVASRVWSLIQEPKSVTEILGILLNEYNVESSQCERDLLTLLEQLAERGLIETKVEMAD